MLAPTLMALSMGACRDARSGNPFEPGASIVARLEKVSGDGQSQIVNRVLIGPLVVRAIAADGTPVAAAPIVFSSLEGGSFQGGNRVLTDANGRASIWWVMGQKAGEQTTTVIIDGEVRANPIPGLTFRANALADKPERLDLLVPVFYGVPVAPQIRFDLSARISDFYGNVVPGILVRWSSPTLGSLEIDSTLSDGEGVVSTRWTIVSSTGGDVAPSYDSVSLRIEDARLNAAVSRTIHRQVGARAADIGFAGEWRALSWEFFTDRAMTQLIQDVIADGMSGILTFKAAGNAGFTWHWRERYRWWGPTNGTDWFGRMWLSEATMLAVADSAVTRLECDWGDCAGPLHGHHKFHRVGKLLIVTRAEQGTYYNASGPRPAWTRLTLLAAE
ncbi:MAG: hypothetical protein ACT4R6_11135 [Gemmatimonadaceae bacterium]